MGASVSPSTLRQALEPWCAVGATGALRVEDPPGGAIFIVEGGLTYAECGLVSGVDKLLTASGRVPAEVWRGAVAAGRATGRTGESLIAEGHISHNELALSVLSALMDAAFFLFDAAVGARFEPDAVNPLGPFCYVEFAAACAEVDRRRRLLTDVWPEPAIDTAAVVPSRRLRGHQVSLTAVQWEIVANADRRRSPADLARLLGRETFVMLLEARRLVRSGLIEPGRPGGSAVAESVAAVRARTAAALIRASEQRGEARAAIPLARGSAAVPVVTAQIPESAGTRETAVRETAVRETAVRETGNRENGNRREAGADHVGIARETGRHSDRVDDAGHDDAGRDAAGRDAAGRDGERAREPTAGPMLPLPRRRLAEPHRWPVAPVDQVRAPVEECSDSTLMRILRALR